MSSTTTTTTSSSSSSSTTPVWLITACTSGFGAALAHEALSRNHLVIATARSAARLAALRAAGATTLDLDVTADEATLAAAVARAAAVHGRLTHVVNCAGYVLEGTVEECSAAEVAATLATNVEGSTNVTRAAAPFLRAAAAAGAGGEDGKAAAAWKPALAHFGSMASWSSSPALAHYSATKWAVSGLVEGLAGELGEFGVAVTVVEPGYFRTGFLNTAGAGGQEEGASVHRVQSARTMPEVYGKESAAGKMRALMDTADNNQLGDVAKGARVIVDVLTSSGVAEGRAVPLRLVLGSDCVEGIRQKLKDTEALLKEWEEISKTTDH